MVVGRSPNEGKFAEEILEDLYNGYFLGPIHSLGEPSKIDEQERFLGLISHGDDPEFDAETQTERLNKATRSARLFDTAQEALDYAGENYGLSEDRIHAHEHMREVMTDFPPVSAEEAEMFMIMDALMRTGRVTICPAKLDDDRAVALVQITYGHGEIRITPLAILATEELKDRLELPYER